MTHPRPAGAGLSRRSFLTGAAVLAGGLGVRARQPAADPLRIAIVGAGNRGAANLRDLNHTGAVTVVALCDCDARQAVESFGRYPDAARYSDWRRLLDREKDLHAVVVSTPDHNHAVIAVAAMRLGRHVYCEKPLARSIHEARTMARVAAEQRVVTQMGTQGHAYEGTRRAVEILRAGVIGEVTAVHVWTDRPAGWWSQGITRPIETPPVPDGLDWDVWLGPAPARPYHGAYVPFTWRGFWDFGTGAIGDMGIHNLDTAYWGLDLGAPVSVTVRDCAPAMSDPAMRETAPLWSIIEVRFPPRGDRPGVTMTWYDGGKLPPAELFHGERRIGNDGGSLVVGSKGTLFTRSWHGGLSEADMFVLLPRKEFVDFVPPAPTLPQTPSHHQEWVDSCRGHGTTQSPFSYAAGLTEALLVGNLALRTGRSIEWDSAAMRATNAPEADAFIRPEFRRGWSL
jgi:predicted dehydrogenase